MNKQYLAKVARTAYGTAHARTFTNIPFSLEVFQELDRILKESGEKRTDQIDRPLIPFFEARYFMINKVLEEEDVRQVLEVASGLSMRGVDMASNWPEGCLRYTEVDQPVMVALKKKILESGVKQLFQANALNDDLWGWHLGVGNALNKRSLAMASRHFKEADGEIAVVNEGLLVYFDHDEKARYAANVRQLLERFGGVWVTSDIMTDNSYSNVPDWPKIKKKWYRRLGKNLDKCNFRDVQGAKTFYEGLGFSVEVRWLSEMMSQLASPKRLKLPHASVKEMLGLRPVFVMRLR